MGKHIEHFTQAKDCTIEQRIINLMKLQHVLEMLALMEKYLDLPMSGASQAARYI